MQLMMRWQPPSLQGHALIKNETYSLDELKKRCSAFPAREQFLLKVPRQYENYKTALHSNIVFFLYLTDGKIKTTILTCMLQLLHE